MGKYNFNNEELKHIIEETTKRVLNEMATPRKEYVDYAHHMSYDIMEHLIKVCLFEDIVPHSVPHWRSEIYGFCKSIVMDRLKNNVSKEKAFDEGAVEIPFGKDLDELNPKFFADVILLYKNKEPKYRLYTTETPEDAYKRSIDRIMKFYDGFRESAINCDIGVFSVALDDFINNK